MQPQNPVMITCATTPYRLQPHILR